MMLAWYTTPPLVIKIWIPVLGNKDYTRRIFYCVRILRRYAGEKNLTSRLQKKTPIIYIELNINSKNLISWGHFCRVRMSYWWTNRCRLLGRLCRRLEYILFGLKTRHGSLKFNEHILDSTQFRGLWLGLLQL